MLGRRKGKFRKSQESCEPGREGAAWEFHRWGKWVWGGIEINENVLV